MIVDQTMTSSGQRGGVAAQSIGTMNLYTMPPVTEQEKAVALERLKMTLDDLATYGERPADLGALTILEATRTEHVARRLYVVLSSFFDPTIRGMKDGAALIEFKKRYAAFTKQQRRNEAESIERIGHIGPTNFGAAWHILLQYCILRIYRGGKEAVISSGFQFVEASPDQAEDLFVNYVERSGEGSWLLVAVREQEELIKTAVKVLKPHNS